MFRCPNPKCGQAKRMPVGGLEFLNFDTMDNGYIMTPGEKPQQFNKHEAATAVIYTLESKGLREQDVTCPVCKTIHKADEWLRCFADPLRFDFEMEADQLCHCGGEMYFTKQGVSSYVLECEKCGWIKPGKVVNGG